MDRKILNDKLKKITHNNLYIQIYHILKTDPGFKPSVNNNGLYYDLVPLDELTVEKISNLIKENVQTENKKLVYNSYYNETEEQKLIKQLKKLNLF